MESSSIIGVKELMGVAWNTVKRHWKIFAGIAVFPAAVSACAEFFKTPLGEAPSQSFAIVSIIGAVLAIIMQIATIHAAKRYSEEHSAHLRVAEQYKFAFRHFWSYIWVSILVGACAAGAMAVALVVPLIVSGALNAMGAHSVARWIFVLSALVSFVYAIFFLSMSTYALVADSKKGLSALIESVNLIRGRWLKVFGRIIALCAVVFAIYFLSVIIQIPLFAIFGSSFSFILIRVLLQIALAVFVYPFAIVYVYNLFKSLKSTHAHFSKPLISPKWMIALCWIGILLPFILVKAALLLSK